MDRIILSLIDDFPNTYPIIFGVIVLTIGYISLHLLAHALVGIRKFCGKFSCLGGSLILVGSLFIPIGWYIIGIIGLISDITIKSDKIIDKKIKEKDVEYYRDIPCNKDIFKIYYIAYQYGISAKRSDFLGAIILKWIKEKRVIIADKNSVHKKGSIILDKEYYTQNWDNIQEKQLYQMMYEAAGDGVLESNELKKWCNNRFNKIHKWFKEVMSNEFRKLIDSKELDVDIRTAECIENEKLLEQAKQVCGLKKYLNDFTLIHERENIEVQLFEEYLIVAQILGIANKVMSQFKELYPETIKNVSFDFRDYIYDNIW